MSKPETIEDVVSRDLCTGCGACTQVLNPGDVVMRDIPEVGLRPVIKKTLTTDQQRSLLSVCPGIEITTRKTNTIQYDPIIGPYTGLWVGHATDPEIRFAASSGGVLTALSLYCLNERSVGFVSHTAMDDEQPWKNRTVISRNRFELLSRAGSRYAPSSPCDHVAEMASNESKFVFIGKPCDVAALRKICIRKPALRSQIDTILTFFCAGTPNSLSVRNLAEQATGVTADKIREVHFRGSGWPGFFRIRTEFSETVTNYYSYEHSWGELQKSRGLRCKLCPDGMGELSDIACGDAWHLFSGKNNPGLSVVIARNEHGKHIVETAIREGYVHLSPVDRNEILSSQGSSSGIINRRRQLWGRLFAMKLFRFPHPRFHGFPLFRIWISLPFPQKVLSILGTAKRLFWKRIPKT